LSLRKSNRLKPEPVGQVVRAISSRILELTNLEGDVDNLPSKPGVYIFFDEEKTLYAGKADDLRARISNHISTWTYRDIIQGIQRGHRTLVFVVFHELPVTISARELTAYETELIRSRDPEHNRAGRSNFQG